MAKQSEVTITIEAIKADVTALVRAYKAQESANGKAAEVVQSIGRKITTEQVDNAAAQIKAALEPVLNAGSLKVEVSRIKGVLRAMADGYKPDAGMSLRAMYNEAGKGTGRQRAGTGPRHDDKAGKADKATTVKMTPEQERETAIRVLFKHVDDELAACVDWATANEWLFVQLVKSRIDAAQKNEADALAKQTTKPAKPAKVARKRAARKAA